MSVAIDYSSGAFQANMAQGVGTVTASGTIDVSSGQYFNYTPTANTTFAFSNAPASGTAAGIALALTGANVTSGYDIANASYASKSFSVASQDANPTGPRFKSDGTKMYMQGASNGYLYQYSLSTAFDVSSASYDNVSFNVAATASSPRHFEFKSDGTKLYVLGYSNKSFYQFSLSTAWDISTASFTFSADGASLYTAARSDDTIYQYNSGSSALATVAYPSSVEFAGGTAPDGPAIGETDVLVFYTDDGGTTYQGFQAGDVMA